MKFYKYQGAGNDFIIIDDRKRDFDMNDTANVQRLCDRRYGIGSDGLMLLQSHPQYDFRMIYYNADGRESSMCGNGGRCIAAFARKLEIITDKAAFLAVDGPHHASVNPSGDWVSLHMNDVSSIFRDGEAYVLDTGSPHYVRLVEGLAKFPVYEEGYAIRNNDTYREEGINVNFVEPAANDGYMVRTFERGVEDETLACGTGATAVALAMSLHHNQQGNRQTRIGVMGGELVIKFKQTGSSFTDIYLEGPAQFVFAGEI